LDFEQVIKRLEEKLLNAGIRKEPEELENLLSADFLEIGSSGRIYNRAETVEALKDETPAEFTLSDFKAVRISEDIILAVYKAARGRNASLRSSIWRLENGSWKMRFHQGTPVKE
jgi:glyoxylase I family protein